LKVSVDNTRYSDDVISGNVITTNPGAGSSVHEGDTVTIYVSQGQNSQSVQVPDTRGKYKEDAVTMLTNSGLYVYVASEPSTTVDANLVIRQDIAPGSSVQTGSSITITVSTGPENAIVIDPGNTGNTAAESGQDAGAWMCYAQLQAPPDYTEGSRTRITLLQNGNETTVYEGTAPFPYLLNVEGIPGVATGTAYVYLLDEYGNIQSTTRYDGIEFYEQ
jgi:serine/threonine-protein kinase